VFLLNHTADEQKIALPGKFAAVVGGAADGRVTLRGFDVVVMQRV
jgi:hypothetical protein